MRGCAVGLLKEGRRAISANVASIVVVLATSCVLEPPIPLDRSSEYSVPGPAPSGPTCGLGELLCHTGCVALDVDPLNCGRCGAHCPAGQACSSGACGAPPSHDPPGASHFPFSLRARPAVVTVGGVDRIFAVVGDSSVETTRLATKTPMRDWSTIDGGPAGIQEVSGAAGATVDRVSVAAFHAQAAVYVRSIDGHLWQAAYDASGAGPSWRDVSGGFPLLFGNQPLVAAWRPASGASAGAILVATVVADETGNDAVWLCTIADGASSTCRWRRLHAPSADPIPAGSELAIDTRCPYTDFSIYATTQSGNLAWYTGGVWSLLAASDPDLLLAETSIQAFTGVSGSTCYALASAVSIADNTIQPELFAWDGRTVTSTELSIGAPFPDVAGQLGNFAHGTFGPDDVVWLLANTNGTDQPLWRCLLTGGITPTCEWTELGRPPDETTTRHPLGSTMIGAGSIVYLTGHVGPTAVYVFGHDSNAMEWQNHLTYRDPPLMLPTSLSVGEIVAAEYDGTLVVSAPFNMATSPPGAVPQTWISMDDGSTLQPVGYPHDPSPAYPHPVFNGDVNVVFDASGRAFHTIQADTIVFSSLFPGSIRMSALSLDPSPRWSAPVAIAPTRSVTRDRAWLAASPTVPGVLYLTFVADCPAQSTYCRSSHEGRFAYCNGFSDCASDVAAAWCPADSAESDAYLIPSRTGCSADGPGCWVDVDPSGDVWIAVGDDRHCTHPPFIAADVHSIGLHHLGQLPTVHAGRPFQCPGQNEFEGRMQAARACLYFVQSAQASQCNGGAGYPCDLRRWPSQIAVADDVPGVVSVAVQGYRDVVTGGPCLLPPASTACRAEQLFAVYDDVSGQWFGESATGQREIDQDAMLVVNGDRASPLRQEDHVVPAIVALDGFRFAMSWVDFRTPPPILTFTPPNFSNLVIASALITPRASPSSTETYPWVGSAGEFIYTRTGGGATDLVLYGDVNAPAAARLHTHLVNTTTPGPGSISIGLTALVSPFAVP